MNISEQNGTDSRPNTSPIEGDNLAGLYAALAVAILGVLIAFARKWQQRLSRSRSDITVSNVIPSSRTSTTL